jgi:glucokinase
VGVLDVGGSHVTAALARCSADGVVLVEQAGGPLDSAGTREEVLGQLTAPAIVVRDREVADTGRPAGALSGWMVAMPGPFDYVHGRGDFTGVAKFGSIAGVDLRTELSNRLGAAPQQVGFLNDAAAYGIGEWTATSNSVGERPARFVCVTLGTGVGSVFLAGGQPVVSGPTVPPHGWAHLLTFEGRPLEDTVSTRAIIADYQGRASLAVPVEVRRIAEAARGGDVHAQGALSTAMEALGVALAPSLARFGADQVVVGGAMSQSWDLLEAPLRSGLERGHAGWDRDAPALRRSALLADAPLVGAAEWFSASWSPSPAPTP